MHNAAFRELELDYAYVPLRTTARRLKEAVRSITTLGFAGVNVTVPFKRAVMRHMDKLTDTAKAVGAVNTIHPEGNKLIGENTDAPGLTAALSAAGFRPRGKNVLVIGAGGAARAAVWALASAGAIDIIIANRTVSKAKKLAREMARRGSMIQATGLDSLEDFDLLDSRQLVVNSTPLGLKGETLEYDIDSTQPDCIHFDLAYGDKLTPFLKQASAKKRPIIDGRYMLVHQGALSFKLFTGRKAPLETMARAIGLKV